MKKHLEDINERLSDLKERTIDYITDWLDICPNKQILGLSFSVIAWADGEYRACRVKNIFVNHNYDAYIDVFDINDKTERTIGLEHVENINDLITILEIVEKGAKEYE